MILTKGEILAALNASDAPILTVMQVQAGFAQTAVVFDLREQLSRGEKSV